MYNSLMSFKKENPFGILLLAIPFIVGGIILLLRTTPSVIDSPPGRYVGDRVVEMASVNLAHAAGVFGITVGGLIIWFYFKIRES
jgi:hypothetical protein